MKKEVKLKATTSEVSAFDVELEFGRTQADMWISGSGKAQKTLKLKEGDKVEITIKKL